MYIILFLLQLDINTVAAGGGSRLFFRAGMFVVGPESAGANPGPSCYCKGINTYIAHIIQMMQVCCTIFYTLNTVLLL